jgi:hypothetical protein
MRYNTSNNSATITIAQAWEILFEKHNIVSKVSSEGFFKIKSSEINTIKEARLMAKFDQTIQLPDIFKTNNLSILPISRGEYIIGPFRTHEKITYPKCKPTLVNIPDLETIDYSNLYSEASALLFAYNSGIIKDAVNTHNISYTVNGRMSSGCFDYFINNKKDTNSYQRIIVENAQIEIDAGYEFNDGFCIVEAKNIAVDEILVRQLYYPYRLWKNKISKPVIPLLMVFSNDIFHLFHYTFEDENYYNSLKLVSYNSYTFANETILLDEIIDLWKSVEVCRESKIPFPQADSLFRVIDLLSLLFEHSLTREQVTMKYEFDPRQTNYYISACDYLELIERTGNINGEREYQLSRDAKIIMALRYKQKNLAIVRKIFERPVFHKAFQFIIQNSVLPDKKEICNVMRSANLRISEATIERRSATVLSWIDWILRLANDE